jgi:hypothetical protein
MTYTYWKIEREPFSNNTWGSKVTLSDYHDPLVKVALGDSKDTFEFKLTNTNDDYSNYFSVNDKITISRKVDSSTGFTSDDVLMVGIVNDTPLSKSFNDNSVKVSGTNFSETIASAIIFYDATLSTISQALEGALNSTHNFNNNFKVTWNVGNPSLTSTGGSFPVVGQKFFYKPFRKLIEEYSTDQATGDGNYYWFVDKDNTLVWNKRTDVVSYTFDYNTGSFKSFKLGKDNKDVKNYVIIKGGRLPDGRIVQKYIPDWSSVSKHGVKYAYLTDKTNYAETITEADKIKAGLATTEDMSSASYPFTPSWNSTSYASYSDYVDGMRSYIIGVITDYAKSYMDLYKNGKLQLQFGFDSGSVSWGLGDFIQFSNLPIFSIGKIVKLRVKEIQYGNGEDVFVLEEDIGTV